MKEELVKSQYRLPKSTHAGVVEAAAQTRQSQNEFVVECLDAILTMIKSPLEEITIPDIVIKTHAVQANRKNPTTIYHLIETKAQRTAEEPAKSKRQAG